MFNLTLVEKAIGAAVMASGDFPRVVWANRDAHLVKPYIVLSLVPVDVLDETLARQSPVWTGFLAATAVTDLNTFETPGRTMLADLASLFPAGTRLTLDDGSTLLVPDHLKALPPYRDGADYRHPARLSLRSDLT